MPNPYCQLMVAKKLEQVKQNKSQIKTKQLKSKIKTDKEVPESEN